MAEQKHMSLTRSRPPAVEACWLCGIHLPAGQMMADGSSASIAVRWYCLDVRGCTERWTTRRSRPAGLRGAGASAPRAAAEV
jgi:hypothetical protein